MRSQDDAPFEPAVALAPSHACARSTFVPRMSEILTPRWSPPWSAVPGLRAFCVLPVVHLFSAATARCASRVLAMSELMNQ